MDTCMKLTEFKGIVEKIDVIIALTLSHPSRRVGLIF